MLYKAYSKVTPIPDSLQQENVQMKTCPLFPQTLCYSETLKICNCNCFNPVD